ncbi:MAG: dihydropteroate synthase [Bacilli bacterium]|nr:dihydropteroate synthase [Bacilli bacterium]
MQLENEQLFKSNESSGKQGKQLLGMQWGKRTYLMGILNVTPDSFSDGGRFFDPGLAVEHALRLQEDGADILDIGGESTRPGYQAVPIQEEINRIVPVIRALRDQLKIPISVDTYKSEVADAALGAGAHAVNDIWGLKRDAAMAETAAKHRVPVFLMHNRTKPAPSNPMDHVLRELQESIAIARQAGIPAEQIVLDPGIGFGKTYEDNLEVLCRLKELTLLGYPVLLATSRKSVIGKTLNLPADQRLEGTAATVSVGIVFGADLIRVHDVREMKRVAMMTDAIVRLQGKTCSSGG